MTEKQVKITNDYEEEVENLDPEEIEAMKQEVESYNENRNLDNAPLLDPFDTDEEQTAESGYYNVLNIGESMGYVEVPKIGVKLPIYHGTGEEVLSRGAGHMSNTSLPGGGKGTHSVITAHRGLPSADMFTDLDQMEEGDIFQVQVLSETLYYQIDQVKVVLPSETEDLRVKQDKDLVTLITCTPYGKNTHRMLVRGERVEEPEKEMTAETTEESASGGESNGGNIGSLVVLTGVLLLILTIVMWRRMKRVKSIE